jgi:hypothetical protein
MRSLLCFLFSLLILIPLSAQSSAWPAPYPKPAYPSSRRSFSEIFPKISPAVREAAFSSEGYTKSAGKIPASDLAASGKSAIDPQIIEAVFSKKPGFLVESIMVIPDSSGKYSLLDVYNALGRVRRLKGRLYHSHTRDEFVPLFEEVTRIESAKKNVPIADPAPAINIPPSETIFMRLKDANFGDSYYRGDMAPVHHGLRYSLSNYKNISYYFITVIKEEKFNAQFYFELINEGILLYSLAGADVSDFVSSRIDMESAISKRIAVIIGWVVDGIING